MRSTRTPSRMITPRSCAPLANARAAQPGFTRGVARLVEPSQEPLGRGERPQLADGLGGDDVRLGPVVTCHRRRVRDLVHPAGRSGEGQGAAAVVSDRHAGLRLEPRVGVDAVAGELGHGMRPADPGQQPGRMPARPGGDPLALEDEDVGHPQPGEVIGGARARHAAPDHDRTDAAREVPVARLRGEPRRGDRVVEQRLAGHASPSWSGPRRPGSSFGATKAIRRRAPASGRRARAVETREEGGVGFSAPRGRALRRQPGPPGL